MGCQGTLARYYLNKKDWKKASIYAKEIIDKGGFNLVDYQDIFSKNQNDEVILAINHIAEANHGNKYVALVLEASIRDALGITGVSASNGYGMAVPFFRTFDPDDKRITPYNPATGKGIAVSGIVIRVWNAGLWYSRGTQKRRGTTKSHTYVQMGGANEYSIRRGCLPKCSRIASWRSYVNLCGGRE